MDPDTKYALIAWIAVMILITLSGIAKGQNNEIEFEFVVGNSMTSEHKDQCKPWCAHQKNGGQGFILHYRRFDKGGVDIAAGKITFTNSYGNPGKVEFFQFLALKYNYKFVTLEADLWKMRIYGYKKEIKTGQYYINEYGETHERKRYEDIIVDTPPWPIYKLSINPIYALTKNFKISGYAIFFPIVRINFVTMSYGVKF